MATIHKNLSEYNAQEIPNAELMKFGIVVSDWNSEITHALLDGAVETFIKQGAKPENIAIYHVPGSFELIYACNQLAKKNSVDGILAIGNVIQGETKHFDYVCEAVAQGIKDINILTDTPTVFCVLTDNTKQQSIDRAGGKHGNKGIECAIATIQIVDFKKQLNH